MDDFYKRAFIKYGERDIRSLGWNSQQGQHKRFRVFLQEMNLYNKSFLDVGCGFGDFYSHINRRCKRYVGIDSESGMIEVARKKNSSGTFLVANIMTYPANMDSFDYVVASGLFSLNRADWDTNFLKIIKRMFDICSISLVFNCTKYKNNMNSKAHYATPAEVVGLLDSIKYKSLKIIIDYLPNDFTIILYK